MTTATIPTPHFLADGPQVWEFCAYTEENIVTIARWLVKPVGKRRHARRLTGQFRYDLRGARQLWGQLKKHGARDFAGFDD
mgnify:CR=1 FL=1